METLGATSCLRLSLSGFHWRGPSDEGVHAQVRQPQRLLPLTSPGRIFAHPLLPARSGSGLRTRESPRRLRGRRALRVRGAVRRRLLEKRTQLSPRFSRSTHDLGRATSAVLALTQRALSHLPVRQGDAQRRQIEGQLRLGLAASYREERAERTRRAVGDPHRTPHCEHHE